MNTKQKDSPKNLSAFDRFQRLIRGLAAVPKKEIEAEEARWLASRATKKKRASHA